MMIQVFAFLEPLNLGASLTNLLTRILKGIPVSSYSSPTFNSDPVSASLSRWLHLLKSILRSLFTRMVGGLFSSISSYLSVYYKIFPTLQKRSSSRTICELILESFIVFDISKSRSYLKSSMIWS